jgi:tol-pal system protein YbgF
VNRATTVAWVVAALVTGCATRGSVHQVAQDHQALESEVIRLREAQEDLTRRLAELSSSAEAGQARAAELQAGITVNAEEAQRLAQQLNANEQAIKQVNEALSVVAAAVPPPPPPPPPAAPVPEPPKESQVGSAESMYAAGQANFRSREYGQAVLDFLDVVTRHPAHPLAPMAQFWIAEAYYRQHDYRQALLEFQRVVDWEPSNPKIAEALVKSGLCYSNLREMSRAEQAWRRVMREFPESVEADQAKVLLSANGSASPRRR